MSADKSKDKAEADLLAAIKGRRGETTPQHTSAATS